MKKLLIGIVTGFCLLLSFSMAEEMQRIDSDGYLYFMDYTGDYYSTQVMDSLRRVGYIDPGCSTFFTHNPDDEPITCRNYDIELARRFAAWLGAKLEFKVYDFGGIIPAAEGGSIDCIMSNLYYTEEKEESIPFSDVLFEVEITAMVRDAEQAASAASVASAGLIAQMDGKCIGVATGTTFDAIVRNALPAAKIVYINTSADLIAALEAGKIDGFAVDEPAARQFCEDGPPEQIFDHPLQESTRRFVRRLKVLELNIESWDYDFLGMAGEIEAWCNRNQIAPKLANRVQLAFEESTQLLVPALENPRVRASCEYSEQTEEAEWTLSYSGPQVDITSVDDGFALAVLKGAVQSMEHTRDESTELPNHLKFRLIST